MKINKKRTAVFTVSFFVAGVMAFVMSPPDPITYCVNFAINSVALNVFYWLGTNVK